MAKSIADTLRDTKSTIYSPERDKSIPAPFTWVSSPRSSNVSVLMCFSHSNIPPISGKIVLLIVTLF